MSLPLGMRRLLSHYDEEDLDLQRNRSLILSRLLEDGDAADLAWLTASLPESGIAEWFSHHAGRQLSRRSREFWRVVLGRDPGPVHPEAQALWPL